MSVVQRVLCRVSFFTPLMLLVILAFPARSEAPGDKMTFTKAMAERFAAAMPAAQVDLIGLLTLKVKTRGSEHEYQVSLDRVWDFCGRDAERCGAITDEFVAKTSAAIFQASGFTAGEVDISTFRLVLRPAAYVATLQRSAKKDVGAQPVVGQFGGDLWWVLVMDHPEMVRVVTKQDLKDQTLGARAAMEIGRANLNYLMPRLATVTPKASANGVGIIEGGFYASSRLLLHDDEWAKLASTLKGRLLVIAPDPNILVFADGGVRNSREALQRIAEDYAKKSDRPLSLTMFQWTPDGWKAVKR